MIKFVHDFYGCRSTSTGGPKLFRKWFLYVAGPIKYTIIADKIVGFLKYHDVGKVIHTQESK